MYYPSFPDWECTEDFSPLSVNHTSPRWVDVDGNCLDKAQGLTANSVHIEQSFVDAVAAGQQLANVSMLAFRDPDSLKAGNLHNHIAAWEHIEAIAPYNELVKLYLKQVTAQQLQDHVTPKQATPIFQISYCYFLATWRSVSYCLISLLPKCLLSLVTKLSSNVYFTPGTVQEIWALSKPPRLPIFPDDSGLLFNHIWGKTLRDGSSNLFGMRCHPNPALCPIWAVEMYVAVSREIGIDLSRGYLFRHADQKVASLISLSPVPRQNLVYIKAVSSTS